MRPVYPRTQYQMQYGAQGPPRVNAGDISQASGKSHWEMFRKPNYFCEPFIFSGYLLENKFLTINSNKNINLDNFGIVLYKIMSADETKMLQGP